MGEASFDSIELRRRVDHWIDNGGREQLAAAMEMAEKTCANVRESLRVDHETLRHPMTI